MRTFSAIKRPSWVVAAVGIALAGAAGIALGLVTGSATIVGLSGGAAGIMLVLLVLGHLLGTE
jgi:hypothetical protein